MEDRAFLGVKFTLCTGTPANVGPDGDAASKAWSKISHSRGFGPSFGYLDAGADSSIVTY